MPAEPLPQTIQQLLYPNMTCFGCGPGNPRGPYVTAGLDVRYRRPSPLHDPVELRAVVTEVGAAQMTTSAELVFAGRTCASATAVWKRWRPR